MSLPLRCHILIFDLGDVLLNWSSVTKTSISSKTLKAIVSSTTWHYDAGNFPRTNAIVLSGSSSLLTPKSSAGLSSMPLTAFNQTTFSFTSLHFTRDLQAEAQGALRIFVVSNISAPDYEGIFERVFTSAAGMRKPELCFLKIVLDQIKAEPLSVVFVDDRSENVLATRSLGMNGIVFDDVQTVPPDSNWRQWSQVRSGRLGSETNGGQIVAENFANLLILEATNTRYGQFRGARESRGSPSYPELFRERPVLTTDEFPPDLNTTSGPLKAWIPYLTFALGPKESQK
ncbi:hypothetical protein EDB89DRAFT_2245659 [Lactarius sanguifluus]|nr:hypothetical protein EDB89DRAFT_2245659 [Lactarius sanguifluus]